MSMPMNQPEWQRGCPHGNCVEVAKVADRVLIRDSKHPDAEPLSFTVEEWTAFVRGVKDGAFQF